MTRMRKAFSLVECLISLLIIGMIACLMQLVVPNISRLQHDNLKNTTDWYLFVNRLERGKYRVNEVKRQSLKITEVDTGNELQVVSGKQAIYFRTASGGYSPLLVNYQEGSITYRKYNDQTVLVRGRMMNGEIRQAIIVFAPQS